MIQWNKTPKREDTACAKRRVWRTKCGHYKVEESQITYGQGTDKNGVELGYPTVFRAMVLTDKGYWKILSDDFRKRSTAMEALEHYAEHGCLPDKKKRRKKPKREE